MSTGRATAVLVLMSLLLACSGETPPSAAKKNRPPGTAATRATRVAPEAPVPTESCEPVLRELRPMDPTDAAALSLYERNLPHIQLFARTEPFLFLSRPAQDPSPDTTAARARIPDSHLARRAVAALVRSLRTDRPRLRRILLSDGYLFEDRFEVARIIAKEVSLSDFFDEPTIYRETDGAIEALTRSGDDYLDSAGARAKLLLNTRVAIDPAGLAAPRHLDAGFIARTAGARRVVPVARYADSALVELVYADDTRIRAVIGREGPQTVIRCAEGGVDAVPEAALRNALFHQWIDRLSDAAQQMVDERLDFDEPENEPDTEQEDGKLRIEWEKAYLRRQKTFFYRELEYDVYDRSGNPTPPQVCIDFIVDTWERASGNWYRRRGGPPGRTEGSLDFNSITGLNTRHTPSMLDFAAGGNAFLERFDVPQSCRVPFRQHARFADAVAQTAAQIREGDVLVIHGLREEDQEEHYHTALVLAVCPITGMPLILADNAGRSQIRTLASTMRSAPRRMIKHLLRLHPDRLSPEKSVP